MGAADELKAKGKMIKHPKVQYNQFKMCIPCLKKNMQQLNQSMIRQKKEMHQSPYQIYSIKTISWNDLHKILNKAFPVT